MLSLVPFFGCYEAYRIHHEPFTQSASADYYQIVGAKLQQYLAAQERTIMQKFFKLGSLTQDRWERWKQECATTFQPFEHACKKEFLVGNQMPKQSILNKVRTLLAKYGKGNLAIVPSNEWLMTAYDSFITINGIDAAKDPWLEHHVLHELTHISNRDFFTGYCMQKWFSNHGNKISAQTTEAFFEQFNHFKETRAELCALLNKKMPSIESHLKYIKHYQQNCFGCRSYTDATHNHPSSGYLYEQMDYLCELMRSEKINVSFPGLTRVYQKRQIDPIKELTKPG